MRQIEDTPMGNEIIKITSNINSGVNYIKNKIILHTKEYDIPITMVESVEILRDFNNNTSDYIIATFHMGMGDYIKDIYPFRDNLNLTIIKIINGKKVRYNYKFVMLNNQMNINGTRYSNSSREELNQMEYVRVVGQCVDRISEALRLEFTSGIYHNLTLSEAMYSLLLSSVRNVTSMLGAVNMNVNIAPPNNEKTYSHIKIPTGINILDVPTYLQEKNYGVYNGGMGTYFITHDSKHTVDNIDRYNSVNNIYVYPLYDNTRFDNSKKKLIIYAVSSAKFDMVENTYLLDGDVLSIIAGLATNSLDDGGNNQLNTGVGFTNTKPDELMERNSQVTDNRVIVNKNDINSGIIDKERRDTNNLTKHIGSVSNIYPYRTSVVKDSMMVYQVQWNFCDADLIFPGMAVMFVYSDSMYGLVKLKGTVQSLYILANEGTKTTNALVNIMVEKPFYKPERTVSKSNLYDSKA